VPLLSLSRKNIYKNLRHKNQLLVLFLFVVIGVIILGLVGEIGLFLMFHQPHSKLHSSNFYSVVSIPFNLGILAKYFAVFDPHFKILVCYLSFGCTVVYVPFDIA